MFLELLGNNELREQNQTVELEFNLDQHGFDFQLAVLKSTRSVFIILQCEGVRSSAGNEKERNETKARCLP